jgi:hypothetical protein
MGKCVEQEWIDVQGVIALDGVYVILTIGNVTSFGRARFELISYKFLLYGNEIFFVQNYKKITLIIFNY